MTLAVLWQLNEVVSQVVLLPDVGLLVFGIFFLAEFMAPSLVMEYGSTYG